MAQREIFEIETEKIGIQNNLAPAGIYIRSQNVFRTFGERFLWMKVKKANPLI